MKHRSPTSLRVMLIFGACCTSTDLWAAPVAGWFKDTSFGGGAMAVLSSAATDAPILGNGSANNADNTAIYAAFPLVSLANGERVTLSGAAEMIGTSPNGDFRWGLFKDDGLDPPTAGWLGYMASAESTVWSKDPAGSSFSTTTFASVASGRGAVLGQMTEPNGLAFAPGTYDFDMTVERYGNEIDVQISITNAGTGFTILSPPFTESSPARLTFDVDRVGFLAGSALDADQVRFSGIDVARTTIDAPTLDVHSSGLVFITSSPGQSFELVHYEVTSSTGALNPAGWTSLDSQENNDPIGSGWEEAGGSSSSVLGEVNLLSSASVSNGTRLSLGHAFDPAGLHDLAFRFTTPDGEIRRGVVNYTLSGDYNRDGRVDAADYVTWRDALGNNVPLGAGADGDGNGLVEPADYNIWKANFGATTGSAAAQAAAAPEPSFAGLALWSVAFILRRPAKRLSRRFA